MDERTKRVESTTGAHRSEFDGLANLGRFRIQIGIHSAGFRESVVKGRLDRLPTHTPRELKSRKGVEEWPDTTKRLDFSR